MRNKKLLYGVISILIVILGIVLFILGKTSNIQKPSGKIVVKYTGGAGLLIAECADKSYIAKEADYIIEGIVEKVESKWNEDKTSILTYADFRIENYVKGKPFKENELQFITHGGQVGETRHLVEDEPIFHQGKKVRVYLKETNGELLVACGHAGVEDLSEIEEKIVY